MIISVSRRTDIPAYFGEWFMHRLGAGFCRTANPFNPTQIATISLKPEEVAAFVFWSKNPAPFLKRLDEIDERGFRYYFQFTLNEYPKDLEPNLPHVQDRLDTFCELAERLGPERMVWRYDPVLISNKTPYAYHEDTFGRLTESLLGATKRCMTSVLTLYRKTQRRLSKIPGLAVDLEAAESPEIFVLLANMHRTAEQSGITLHSCAQPVDYSKTGVRPGACVDGKLAHDLWGVRVDLRKDTGQRKDCLCSKSKDIGRVDTCLAGCVYCYSTVSHEAALRLYKTHDRDAASL